MACPNVNGCRHLCHSHISFGDPLSGRHMFPKGPRSSADGGSTLLEVTDHKQVPQHPAPGEFLGSASKIDLRGWIGGGVRCF